MKPVFIRIGGMTINVNHIVDFWFQESDIEEGISEFNVVLDDGGWEIFLIKDEDVSKVIEFFEKHFEVLDLNVETYDF